MERMQNFASPASKFCHLIAGQKLVKTHFCCQQSQSLKLVQGPNVRPIFSGLEAHHEHDIW
jgi:hypothetical protein